MKRNKKIKVLVLYGGSSFEHEISVKTGKMVVKYLDKDLYQVEEVFVSKKGMWFFNTSKQGKIIDRAIGTLIKKKYDIAFIAMHGEFGEDGHIQAILDSINLPYTGSGVLASALSIDKERANMIFKANDFFVPKFYCFGIRDWKENREFIEKRILRSFKYPVVVKPTIGGSSMLTAIVKKQVKLVSAVNNVFKKFDRVMVQKFIGGDEITCSVIEKNGRVIVLPLIRIIPKKGTFYSHKSKYQVGGSIHELPAKISPRLTKTIQEMALRAHAVFGCSDMSRTDFILSGGKPFVLEINTIPGLTKTSLLPDSAKYIGISFTELLTIIIKSALERKL